MLTCRRRFLRRRIQSRFKSNHVSLLIGPTIEAVTKSSRPCSRVIIRSVKYVYYVCYRIDERIDRCPHNARGSGESSEVSRYAKKKKTTQIDNRMYIVYLYIYIIYICIFRGQHAGDIVASLYSCCWLVAAISSPHSVKNKKKSIIKRISLSEQHNNNKALGTYYHIRRRRSFRGLVEHTTQQAWVVRRYRYHYYSGARDRRRPHVSSVSVRGPFRVHTVRAISKHFNSSPWLFFFIYLFFVVLVFDGFFKKNFQAFFFFFTPNVSTCMVRFDLGTRRGITLKCNKSFFFILAIRIRFITRSVTL